MHPRQILGSKARNVPVLHMGRIAILTKIWPGRIKLAREKHTSLLCHAISDKRKGFPCKLIFGI
jgi:hypothetical protein